MGKYVERATKVFLDTDTRFPRSIIWAMGMIKLAAAKANYELGLLDEERANAVIRVAREVAEGKHDDKVIVDVFQTGSGTGLNMNINELIAEEASRQTRLRIHPNDHVNMGQSSNDVVPTAIRLAALLEAEKVLKALEKLIEVLRAKSREYKDLIKPGRTHLRDALPVTLGQELEAFAEAFERDKRFLELSLEFVREVPLGGTAVGTGLNAHPEYPRLAIEILSRETGIRLRLAANKSTLMKLLTDLSMLSAAFRAIAIDLWGLSQDLRLMYSGPNTGLNEIDIPQDISGSSMMPGKTNPVTLEAVMQAAVQVMGLDDAISRASLLGEFELSMGIPLAGYNIVREATLITESINKMTNIVLSRIRPNAKRMRELAEKSQALITILSPLIGYEEAAKLGRLLAKGKSIYDALKELGLSDREARELLDLNRLVKPGIPALEAHRRVHTV